MEKLTITKEFKFEAAHQLLIKDDEKLSETVFGKCFSPHGHSYKLFVTVSGLEKYGMIINFTELKKTVNEYIIDDLDHTMLNGVTWLSNGYTTCEVIIQKIWDRLTYPLNSKGVHLEKLVLYETEKSCATLER